MGWFSRKSEEIVSSTVQRGDRLLVTLASGEKREGVVTSTNFDGNGEIAVFVDGLVSFIGGSVGGTVVLRPEQINRHR